MGVPITAGLRFLKQCAGPSTNGVESAGGPRRTHSCFPPSGRAGASPSISPCFRISKENTMATLPRPAEPNRSPSLELLEPPPFFAKPKRLLDVSDVAEWLGVSKGWIRDHASGR